MDQNQIELQINELTAMYINKLEKELEFLILNLQTELDSLRKSKEAEIEYLPSCRGIIRGEGMAIDELCIKIGLLKSMPIQK